MAVFSLVACGSSGGGDGETPKHLVVDTDGDGIIDDLDQCPETPAGALVDGSGCQITPVDTDDDGVADYLDQCPGTPVGTQVDDSGCQITPVDTDDDGVADYLDQCPGTPVGTQVDDSGCPVSVVDADGDGVPDERDVCPGTSAGIEVDDIGCPKMDTDGDGVPDERDNCINTPLGVVVNEYGCPGNISPDDADGDGVLDNQDQCPNTPLGSEVDPNGCMVNDGSTKENAINLETGLAVHRSTVTDAALWYRFYDQGEPPYSPGVTYTRPGQVADSTWFRFFGQEGWWYNIITHLKALPEHEVRLFAADDTRLGYSQDGSHFSEEVGARIWNWECKVDGVYYVQVVNSEPDQEYTISLVCDSSFPADLEFGFFPNSPNHDKWERDTYTWLQRLLPEGEVQERTFYTWAGVEYGERVFDRDYFSVYMEEGKTYKITVLDMGGCDAHLWVNNPSDGTILIQDDPLGTGSAEIVMVAPESNYYLCGAYSHNFSIKGYYHLSVVEVE
ncbi:hypothetical protein DSLASN_05430 [Desulfoluna limicola]|uniref:Thrombospondin type 3 repeat-containing protein n=2 Tax=Desulfoluna limicola TaxID=2810562 RepID=A0ABM7PCN6_9BACT|nr:hypothetical protein DSLASN_05430 [Desulfoluna limicola]